MQARPLPEGRSLLFAPANHPRRAEKVFACGADIAILDLEDAIAVSEKAAARQAAVDILARQRQCVAFVRVNGVDSPWCHADLQALVGYTVDGIVLPKVESASALAAVDWLIGQLEIERDLEPGRIELLPLIETARGVMALGEIVRASTRVRRLAFGGADYTNDLGLTWTHGEDEFAFIRAQLTHWSRIAGLAPPIDTVTVEVRDSERFTQAAQRAKRLGFGGKLCIHPDQVPLANAIFSPSDEEVARAQAIVDQFEQAEREGVASIQVAGQFVDYPVVERARRVLQLASRRQQD